MTHGKAHDLRRGPVSGPRERPPCRMYFLLAREVPTGVLVPAWAVSMRPVDQVERYLERESVGADQDEGRIAPELGELAKGFRLLGKKARH